MKIILSLFIAVFSLNAATITLDEILLKVQNEHPLAKSIEALKGAHSSQNRAAGLNEPLEFSAEGAYAKPDLDKSGYEYSVGVAQNIMHPNVKKGATQSLRYQNESEILELEHEFFLLRQEVKLLYHVNCLNQKNTLQYRDSFLAFEKFYEKKKRAYEYGEISKKDLLALQIELNRIKAEYKLYENEVNISRDNLESKTLLPFLGEKELSCKDTTPIIKELQFDYENKTLKEQSLEKKILTYQSDFERYNVSFDSFTLGAAYQNELDTDKFVFSLSMPLNFTTSLYEENRAAALHKKSALMYEKEGIKLQKSSHSDALKKELAQNFESINAYQVMVQMYENELMPLVKSAYDLGEASVIEYLLSQRELLGLKKELVEHYKKYYKTLFEIYSVLQTKEKL
ncbi:MAG: TolC family protein [Sulfurimonas sp.]|uniref:TolC family protein n=1 Tax=Sulfurimonas sp. TaxID=2022749 RepID=UPI0028CECD6D|nr:TolC family protein [Sulfurimonas sp.]MDT8338469.1 TolC family protein [Sulfurimonas sp.]